MYILYSFYIIFIQFWRKSFLPYIKFHNDIRCTGIEPRTVADFAWIVKDSNSEATSHSHYLIPQLVQYKK